MSDLLSRRNLVKMGIIGGAALAINALPARHAYAFKVAPNLSRSARGKRLSVRRNVLSLKERERSALVEAFLTIKNTIPPGSSISIYDQILAIHVGVTGFNTQYNPVGPASGIIQGHIFAGFTPWHRELTMRVENALQSVNPEVSIPYWDWRDKDAIDSIFQDKFLGPSGSGRIVNVQGTNYEGGGVSSGPFTETNGWSLIPELALEHLRFTSMGSALKRFIRVPPFDRSVYTQLDMDRINSPDHYGMFKDLLEGFFTLSAEGYLLPTNSSHGHFHFVIGGALLSDYKLPGYIQNHQEVLGTMTSIMASPYDPAFWLLHANVDRVWAEWQDAGHFGPDFYPATGEPFGHNLNDLMWPWDGGLSLPGNVAANSTQRLLPQLDPDDLVRPLDTLDIRALGYRYDTMPERQPNRPSQYPSAAQNRLAEGLVLKHQYHHH
jgi:tyrosinase